MQEEIEEKYTLTSMDIMLKLFLIKHILTKQTFLSGLLRTLMLGSFLWACLGVPEGVGSAGGGFRIITAWKQLHRQCRFGEL